MTPIRLRVVTITSIRERVEQVGGGFAHTIGVTTSRPSLLARLIWAVALLIGGVLILVIVVPLAIFGLILTGVIFGYGLFRAWLTGARAPNGPLDGRRNVRVVEPPEPREGV